MKEQFENPDLLATLFNSVPIMLLVVDDNLKVETANLSAAEFLNMDANEMHGKMVGEVFHCVHASETEEGCGNSSACPDCVVRNSVRKVLDGEKVVRARARLEYGQAGKSSAMHMMVSTAPMEHDGKTFVTLAIEDISELVKLHRLLPMCTECKKIRDDDRYWHNVEEYIAANSDVKFSQAVCPECAKRLYPEIFG